MAGSTFIELTNRVLRKINEVELTESNFASTRGLQSICKDAVRDSIMEINQQDWDWPYHAIQTTQTLQPGVNEYVWPVDFKTVDWNSFQIVKSEEFNINNTHLEYIDRDEWYSYRKDIDEDNGVDGRLPIYVFKSHGIGFGVTPAPDKTYTIEYRYYRNETPMSVFGDKTDIPVQFDNIIVMGALWHMNLFRENAPGVGIAQEKFKAGIKAMYNILVGIHGDHIRDTRVNFGGPVDVSNGVYHT